MELSWAADASCALRHGPARGTPLRIVQQTLAREERLLATGEDELACAIPAGEGPVLEHAGPSLPFDAMAPVAVAAPRTSWSVRRADRRDATTDRTGLGPGLMCGQ
jgi:hypothetical protein